MATLRDIGVEPEELLDLDPGRDGRRDLVRFVACELSETGRFKRIASKGKSSWLFRCTVDENRIFQSAQLL